MGLNISLCKIVKSDELAETEERYFSFIDDEETADLNRFIKYFGKDNVHVKSKSYYDMKAAGITDEQYEWMGYCYNGNNSYVSLIHKKHELYSLYKKIEENPRNTFTIFADDAKLILKYKWKEYIEKNTYIHHPDNIFAILDNNDRYTYYKLFYWLCDVMLVTKMFKDIPQFIRDTPIVYYKEVGYQRKGLNGAFFKNYTPDDFFVFEKEKLEYIYDNYVEEDCKEYFKEHILEPFITGEHVVTFSW